MSYSIGSNLKMKKIPISLTRGDTLKLKIEILVNNEVYTPEEEDIIRFAMKQSYSSSKVLIKKIIPNDTLILYIEPKDTKKLPFGTYVYDIEITFANGDVDTFIKGSFKLEEQVE